MLKPLARYGREKAVTYAALSEVSRLTRDWYFAEGGLYLTAASRKPYFRWKKHMQELLDDVDGVILCAPHSAVDYELVVNRAPLILDTSNALKAHQSPNVVPL